MKKQNKKLYIDWFGILLMLSPLLILVKHHGVVALCVTAFLFITFWLPIVAIMRDWGSTEATCHWCNSKKVNNMFQTEMGSIYYGCNRHAHKSKASGSRFTFLRA